MERTVHVVPHSHWDREWHEPLATLRLRLLDAVETILELLEAEPAFVFTFDGQTAAIEDYLALRPEDDERVRGHVAAGRLLLGPWRVLADELLPSGETLARNLESGWCAAERLGGVMRVGYLPDMFGHAAQMPQLLARAGLADAVVWRGVPAAIDARAFEWRAPDGSAVRAEHLRGGYGRAAHLLADAERAAEDVRRAVAADTEPGGRHVLLLHGDDHIAPPRALPEHVARADAELDDVDVGFATLPAYLDAARGDDGELPVWRGELRSAARANLLPGVASTRVDVKAAAARAERALERFAEPLAALFGDNWPQRELDLAWARVVENAAHDSICACSHDEAVAQVAVRYAEAARTGDGLAGRALAGPAARAPADGAVVWNPSPWPRTDEIAVDVAADLLGDAGGLQVGDGGVVPVEVDAVHPEVLLDQTGSAADAVAVLDRRHGRELHGQLVSAATVEADADPAALTVHFDRLAEPADLDVEGLVADVRRRVRATADRRWRVRLLARPYRRVRARVSAPPLGWTTAAPTPQPPTGVVAGGARRESGVISGPGCDVQLPSLANDRVRVAVAADGTLTVDGDGVTLTGVGRLVDGGDAGDTYNYAPPAADREISEPDEVAVTEGARGPAAAGLRITRHYRWPTGLTPDRTARDAATAPVAVHTDVEVRAGEPFVRVRLSFDNPARNHRLRWHVPLPAPPRRIRAAGQFAVVDRTGRPEGGHGERPVATEPAHDFVAADGAALLLDHAGEYEVAGADLALTLLRATGELSVTAHPWRAEPAGPEITVPANQMLGPCHARFAVRPTADPGDVAALAADAERYQLGFLTRAGAAAAGGVAEAAGLSLQPNAVALTSLRRDDGGLRARLLNLADEAHTAELRGPFRAVRRLSLLGAPLEDAVPADGRATVPLGAHEIATLRLEGSLAPAG